MKKNQLFVLMLAAAFWLPACNNGDSGNKDSVEAAKDQNDNNKTVDDKVSAFMTKAASGGMMEVEAGQLAQSKGQNQRVKDFGGMLIKDHTQANTEMKALAGGKNVALPSSLGEDHQKHINELQQKSGADFDKAFMSMMVDDHKKDISEFEDATKLDDADVKGFATKTLPVLRSHLDSAQAIHDAIK